MYYPYFRGKQFELIAIRETAELLARSNFVPIIEPVKEVLNGLERALKSICDAQGSAIVIVNPDCGDHHQNGSEISELLRRQFSEHSNVSAGILLKKTLTAKEIFDLYTEHKSHMPVFIHAGFLKPQELIDIMGDGIFNLRHIFIKKNCPKLYRRKFRGLDSNFILICDGFEKRKNADYPPEELFSEVHMTFLEDGMSGFGDFLTVGNDYIEGGGPAYAVAIHLTFIDPTRDDIMYIYHFTSTSNDTPTDPAGKFAQALEKLVKKIKSGDSKLFMSDALQELLDLHRRGHFPGLGSVKKISMKHHIETMSNYLNARVL